ncbi:MAG: M48 family metalloprotease [Planctomycetota bacterium]|nr:M48 family metalloprotease [Planctomycetota bacterium]MDA1178871.1 M48 family metalloprotease [Planctomycetota bacterium]
MQLVVILVLVVTACSTSETSIPALGTPVPLCLWLMSIALGWCTQAYLVARVIRGWQDDVIQNRSRQSLSTGCQFFPHVWVIVNLWLVNYFRIDTLVWQVSCLPEVVARNAIALTVALLPLPLAWICHFELFAWTAKHSNTSDVQSQGHRHPTSFVWQRLCHYVVPGLLPISVVLAVREIQTQIPTILPVWFGVACGMGLLLTAIGMPWILKWTWRCRSLEDSDLHRQLQQWCGEFQVSVRDICVWQTRGQIVNAAICGFLPPCRMIFLSDGLLETLSSQQLRCVLAHEAAHIRGRHVPRTMLMVAIPLVMTSASQISTEATGSASITIGLVLMVALAIQLGWASRLAEHEADVSACRLLSRSDTGPALATVVQRYIETLECLDESTSAGKSWDWLHPQTTSRCHILRQMLASPDRQRWSLRWKNLTTWGLAGFIGAAAQAALESL